ncbi:Phosphocarrier protein HPr [Rubripirellula lacrimiformis]|uniref:Phosphocarrier protein HPr n=1 Tax=Rubripirellula lacrimiformis TaxID=1930273 RepID=A0A517NK85_9BACT|nr:HPr family phosphocarrier protein [Rubripirellula lacrimiformis]QDT07536.1 Phosphocarrier protein HPr [Rubripirellula lacrimiformis]
MSNDASLTRTVVVQNAEGLHARPADLLVRMANKFHATIRIGKNSEWVDCKSILSLLTLGAAQGTELSVAAEGEDAAAAIDAITALFEAGFDDTDEMKGVKPAVDS